MTEPIKRWSFYSDTEYIVERVACCEVQHPETERVHLDDEFVLASAHDAALAAKDESIRNLQKKILLERCDAQAERDTLRARVAYLEALVVDLGHSLLEEE